MKILIADDQEQVRRGLRFLIESRPEWTICGEAADGQEAVDKANELKPDIAVLDVSMPRMSGLDAARIIRRQVPDCQILIVSQNDPAVLEKAAAEAGAQGFVQKMQLSKNLLRSIEQLVENRVEPPAPQTPNPAPAAPAKFQATYPSKNIKVRDTELLITDPRKQYREKIARITLDSMVQFVGLLDANGTVLEINSVALEAVGVKLSEVEGRPFWTTFWWQASEEINAELKAMIGRAASGEFVRWDTEIYGRAGGKETIIIDASLMPVKDDQGKVVFITAEGRDITEKKAHEREIARQREELAKLDELKTQFFANISHEFRTPLTLMMGPLEDALAELKDEPGEMRERIELAHRNSLRLLKLVNTLLDFSRIEAGRIEASYEPTDLAALTADLASTFRSAIERAKMRLVVDCPALPERVFIDREMWEKVVLNLLSNAFKFTFEGEIKVTLRPAGPAAELRVSDTGTGIPEEEIPQLFERFHRVRGARGRSYEGSGIGLALVRELVKLHGGTVAVTSESGRGTTFTVTIPFGKEHLPADRIGGPRTMVSTGTRSDSYVQEALRWLAPQAEHEDLERNLPPSPAAGAASPRHAGARARILVVDDNADMRDYVQRLLSDQYHVEAVADGEAALNAVRRQRPDVILSDVMMPRIDGFQLLRRLRAQDDSKDIPVILLSARAGEESRLEGLNAGADDYLVKPFSARELVGRVASTLAMAKLRDEATGRERELRTAAEQERNRIGDLFIHATRELEKRNSDITRQAEELRRLSWRLLRTQEEERRHIARELHDSAGQTLAVLGLNLDLMVQAAQKSSPEIVDSARETQELVQQLTREIRTTSYLLHPPLLDENGLPAAVSWYVRGLTERSGLDVNFTISEEFGRLPREMEMVIFRLVQECLTNIHRHSGSKSASIAMNRDAERVLVEVHDQGKGIAREKLAELQSGGLGVGIRGMRERLRQFQGDMIIDSNSGGTTVVVTIPLGKEMKSADTSIEDVEAGS